jgi:Protein of unknown function (DUF1415)
VNSIIARSVTLFRATENLICKTKPGTSTIVVDTSDDSTLETAILDALAALPSSGGLRVGLDPDYQQKRLFLEGVELEDRLRAMQSSFPTAGAQIETDMDFVVEAQRTQSEICTRLDATAAQIEDLDAVRNDGSRRVLVCSSGYGLESRCVEKEVRQGRGKVDNEGKAYVQLTKSFVDKFIVAKGVCPYTTWSDMAATGPILSANSVAPAPILYPVSSAVTSLSMMADVFDAAVNLLSQPEETFSTTLLSAPWFAIDDFAREFAPSSLLLSKYLSVSGALDDIGIVTFHPDYDRAVPSLPYNVPLAGHLPASPFLRTFLFASKAMTQVTAVPGEMRNCIELVRRQRTFRLRELTCLYSRVPNADALHLLLLWHCSPRALHQPILLGVLRSRYSTSCAPLT